MGNKKKKPVTLQLRHDKAGGGKGALVQKDKSATLFTTNNQVLFEPKDDTVVRRLMPVECARLQGFPDDWCDGVEGTDAMQYRMWGNGVALPCVLYIFEGIAEYGKEQK